MSDYEHLNKSSYRMGSVIKNAFHPLDKSIPPVTNGGIDYKSIEREKSLLLDGFDRKTVIKSNKL